MSLIETAPTNNCVLSDIVDLTRDYFGNETFTVTSLRVLLHNLGVSCHFRMEGQDYGVNISIDFAFDDKPHPAMFFDFSLQYEGMITGCSVFIDCITQVVLRWDDLNNATRTSRYYIFAVVDIKLERADDTGRDCARKRLKHPDTLDAAGDAVLAKRRCQ
jgi:hypothetical protein